MMSKLSLLLFSMFFMLSFLEAQVINTIVYQPGPLEGKDADIQSVSEFRSVNFGDKIWLRAESWTRNGIDNFIRGLIDFPYLDQIDEPDSITNITLTLYRDLNYPHSDGGASGDNNAALFLINEEWDENVVTWANQPNYDNTTNVNIPTNNDYDSIVIDLTQMVKNRLLSGQGFYGLLLKNVIESPYKSLNFTASDGEIPERRPKIAISMKRSVHSCCTWHRYGSDIFYHNGNVAIGSIEAGGYKLSVDGVTYSKEVVVDPEGWPDYVFDSGYYLPTLQEVRTFINRYGHLPGVPNVETVEQDGVELSKMNSILLRKVEELNLYILQQDSKLKELEKRLDSVVGH